MFQKAHNYRYHEDWHDYHHDSTLCVAVCDMFAVMTPTTFNRSPSTRGWRVPSLLLYTLLPHERTVRMGGAEYMVPHAIRHQHRNPSRHYPASYGSVTDGAELLRGVRGGEHVTDRGNRQVGLCFYKIGCLRHCSFLSVGWLAWEDSNFHYSGNNRASYR